MTALALALLLAAAPGKPYQGRVGTGTSASVVTRDTGASSFPIYDYRGNHATHINQVTVSTSSSAGYLVAGIYGAYVADDGATPYVPTIAGGGLTWTLAATLADGNGHRMTVYTAPFAAKLTTVTITATVSATLTGDYTALSVDAVVNTSGPGNTATAGVSTIGGGNANPRTIDLSPTNGSTGSMLLAFLQDNPTYPSTADANNMMVVLISTGGGSGAEIEYSRTPRPVSGTYTLAFSNTPVSGAWEMVAVEMKGP